MTVAYLIFSHHLPDQLLSLAGAIRAGSPGAQVVVHHDPRGPDLDRARLEKLGGVHILAAARPIKWGWASQLDALLGAQRWALERLEFDWLVLLSGQDYPARPLGDVERELAGSGLDGYVQGDLVVPPPASSRRVDEFAARYFYRHRAIRRPAPAVCRAILAARPLLTLRDMPWGTVVGHRTATPFSASRPCRRGQDWLTLSRRCVALLDAAAAGKPGLLDHYRHVLHPNESFAHTVLHAEPGLKLSGDPRRYSSWAPGSPHPATLGLADLDAILASKADFARKLDFRVDSRLFDALDCAAGIAASDSL